MPTAESAADGYALALEEARRALDLQERTVAQLSTRAGLLISAAAVVTSFFGGPVLAEGSVDAAESSLHPAPLITRFMDLHESASHPDPRRDVALYKGTSIDHNARELSAMAKAFHIASMLLAVEIVAWVVSIATVG